MNVMTFAVMARPEIKRIEDLKGKKIGVSRFGSATDFGLRYAEEKWPVKRQRDFTVIQSGGVTDVYNALRAGALERQSSTPSWRSLGAVKVTASSPISPKWGSIFRRRRSLRLVVH